MRILLALMWLLHWLPLPILGRLGEGIGSLLYLIMTPRRRVTLINLKLCMPPLSDAARRTLLRVVILDERQFTDDAVERLMGPKPEARFAFIQERAPKARDLVDI